MFKIMICNISLIAKCVTICVTIPVFKIILPVICYCITNFRTLYISEFDVSCPVCSSNIKTINTCSICNRSFNSKFLSFATNFTTILFYYYICCKISTRCFICFSVCWPVKDKFNLFT